MGGWVTLLYLEQQERDGRLQWVGARDDAARHL